MKYFPKKHRREPAEKWILRLQHADRARAQDRATDREHAEETVGRRERIGRDGFEVWREPERLKAVPLIGICHDDVAGELLGVTLHALHVLSVAALPKPARATEGQDGVVFHETASV